MTQVMNIVGQSCHYAYFWKIQSEIGEEITSSLYVNNFAVLEPNSDKVRPTTLP